MILREVHIPISVTSIGKHAFSKLETDKIFYGGRELNFRNDDYRTSVGKAIEKFSKFSAKSK